MVALLIMLVGILGLFSSVNMVTKTNLKNQVRDETVQVAEDWMAKFRATPFSAISTNTPLTTQHNYAPQSVPSALRGVAKNYTVSRSATLLTSGGNSVVLDVKVRWTYKNWSTSHEVVSVRSN